jgi:hypothetical protein
MLEPKIKSGMGIEELYLSCSKLFGVVEGYTEDKALGEIFRMCRLKPYKVIVGKVRKPKTHLSKHWIDEWRNSLYIDKANRMRIVLYDLSIDMGKVRKTDLYDGMWLSKTTKISKLLCAFEQPHRMIVLLGVDGYLRAFVWLDGWKKCSPLLLGLKNLRTIYDYKDVEFSKRLDDGWIIKLPASKEMFSNLDASFLYEALEENNG